MAAPGPGPGRPAPVSALPLAGPGRRSHLKSIWRLRYRAVGTTFRPPTACRS